MVDECRRRIQRGRSLAACRQTTWVAMWFAAGSTTSRNHDPVSLICYLAMGSAARDSSSSRNRRRKAWCDTCHCRCRSARTCAKSAPKSITAPPPTLVPPPPAAARRSSPWRGTARWRLRVRCALAPAGRAWHTTCRGHGGSEPGAGACPAPQRGQGPVSSGRWRARSLRTADETCSRPEATAPRPGGRLGFLCHRRPEQGHDAVAHDVIHRPIAAVDGGNHTFEYRVEQVPSLHRVSVGPPRQ
jgi:hypothetical protein